MSVSEMSSDSGHKSTLARVRSARPVPPDIVVLNVGGHLYTTTRATLLKDPDSLLHDYFAVEDKDNHRVRLEDGSYFIDRNGRLFEFVLEYLRQGRLVLPDTFNEITALREEAAYYKIAALSKHLAALVRSPLPHIENGERRENQGRHITVGFRSTFAFGRDGQAHDVKFRKLQRILVCGKAALCRHVFGDSLNESRDPDREGAERYTSRLFLKHQSVEKAFDTLATNGFRIVACSASGANGLLGASSSSSPGTMTAQQHNDMGRTGDYEEQRWSHYTEYVFFKNDF